MDLKLEAVVIPVSDVDRAKAFYVETLGFRVDIDHPAASYGEAVGFGHPNAKNYRIVQLTPPESECSILIGSGVTNATPGAYQGMHLVTSDIEATRADLVDRGLSLQLRAGLRHPGNMQSVYEAAGGSEGLLRLAQAWHARVMADDIVSHAFSHGFHPQHNERLAAYWAEALGGPTTYSDTYGDETTVVRIHSGNGPHEEMDRLAIACFDQALDDVGLKADEPLRQVLHDYFAWATTTTMSRYQESADDVPEGLSIPRWSWDGLQR